MRGVLSKRRPVIVAVVVILVLGALGYGLLFSSSAFPEVEVAGNLEPRDVKEIKSLVQQRLRSRRVEGMGRMLWSGDIKRIPARVRMDGKLWIRRLRVSQSGNVSVFINLPGWSSNCDPIYVLNHTNGWQIVDTKELMLDAIERSLIK